MRTLLLVLTLFLLPFSLAHAQDSVARRPGLPGDPVVPWQEAAAAGGSEQCDAYVVTLREITSSWGNTFGIAPVVKSSKASTGFFGSPYSTQSISRRVARNVPFASTEYRAWRGRGFGVNNNRQLNRPGKRLLVPPGARSHQVALAGAEFSLTDAGTNYNGVLGAVDEAGRVMIRADDFAIVAGGCGLTPLLGNNIFRVDMDLRDCNRLNVLSNDYPGGLFDGAATGWIVRNSGTTYNTPNLVPASVAGAPPIYTARISPPSMCVAATTAR